MASISVVEVPEATTENVKVVDAQPEEATDVQLPKKEHEAEGNGSVEGEGEAGEPAEPAESIIETVESALEAVTIDEVNIEEPVEEKVDVVDGSERASATEAVIGGTGAAAEEEEAAAAV